MWECGVDGVGCCVPGVRMPCNAKAVWVYSDALNEHNADLVIWTRQAQLHPSRGDLGRHSLTFSSFVRDIVCRHLSCTQGQVRNGHAEESLAAAVEYVEAYGRPHTRDGINRA